MLYFLDILNKLINTIFGTYACYLLAVAVPTRRKAKLTALFTTIAFLTYILLRCFSDLSDSLHLTTLYLLCIHPVVFIALLTVCRTKFLTALTTVLLVYLILSPSALVFLIGNFAVTRFDIPIERDILRNLCYALTPLALGYPCFAFLIPGLRPIVQKQKKELPFLLLFLVAFYLFGAYATSNLQNKSNPSAIALVFSLLFYVSICIIGVIYWSQKKISTMEIDHREMLLQSESIRRQLDLFNETQNTFRAIRHDQRHLLQAVAHYADMQETGKIRQLVLQNIEELESTEIVSFCQNVTINMIVSDFVRRARHKKIAVNTEIDIPRELLVSEMDLTCIMFNALENSLQAAEKLDDGSQREITLRCKTDKTTGQLNISIKNTTAVIPAFNRDGIPESVRGGGHGYGAKRMARAVEKNNGLWQFSVENGFFIFQAVFLKAVEPLHGN